MLTAFVATGFTFGLLAIFFVCPFMLCKGVLLMNEDDFSGFNVVKAIMPIFNIFYAEVQYGRSFPIVGLTNMLAVIMFFVNLVLMFVAPTAVTARMICLFVFFLFTLIAYIASCQLTASMLGATDEIYGLKKVFYILFPPVGYYYIGNYLYKFVLLDAERLAAIEVD